ncbi:MAG TPA: hypothetical protein DHD79_04050 [Firmicutes bacterium]|nr:hypothetical protein [Bacillota bacterium]HAW72081.1 hypothetical protein [Bacillota bacterium]HAZ21818.1 hypothetical protein [Bacillota bacterium]HBG44365.1 hypothetical protein [Bacillota bacterium]HBL50409.1 hypothetical protein [Bacillota bacterium]
MIEINWTLVYTFINFGLLYVVLRLLLYKPIQNTLANRKREISEALEKADARMGEADQLKREYEQKMADLYETARQTLDKARADGKALQDELVAKAQEEAGAIKGQAQADADHLKKRIFTEMREQIVEMAMGATANLTGWASDDEQRRQIELFLSGLESEKRVN